MVKPIFLCRASIFCSMYWKLQKVAIQTTENWCHSSKKIIQKSQSYFSLWKNFATLWILIENGFHHLIPLSLDFLNNSYQWMSPFRRLFPSKLFFIVYSHNNQPEYWYFDKVVSHQLAEDKEDDGSGQNNHTCNFDEKTFSVFPNKQILRDLLHELHWFRYSNCRQWRSVGTNNLIKAKGCCC